MTSIYRWRGAVETANEAVMIIKTRSSLADAVIAAVEAQHPYETPALVVVPVEGGSGEYLAWIMASTRAT